MKVRQYKDILLECLVTLRHARTFVTSREKMHRTGIELYDNLIVEVAEALSAPEPTLPATPHCDHKFRCNRHRDNPSDECCACGATQETGARWMDYGSLDNGHCSFALTFNGAACCLPAGHQGEHMTDIDRARANR